MYLVRRIDELEDATGIDRCHGNESGRDTVQSPYNGVGFAVATREEALALLILRGCHAAVKQGDSGLKLIRNPI